MQDLEAKIELTCDCGVIFTRPQKYIAWNSKNTNVIFRWKIRYCDNCYNKRIELSMQCVKEVITKIIE
jgi:hypothetical protein